MKVFRQCSINQLTQSQLHQPFLNTALLKASLDTKSDIGWYKMSEHVNISAINVLNIERCLDNLGFKGKKLLRNLSNTRISIRE